MANYMPYSGSYASGSSYVTPQPDVERDPYLNFHSAGQPGNYDGNAWFETAPPTSTFQHAISSTSSLAGALDERPTKRRQPAAPVWPESEAFPMAPLSYHPHELRADSAPECAPPQYASYDEYMYTSRYLRIRLWR